MSLQPEDAVAMLKYENWHHKQNQKWNIHREIVPKIKRQMTQENIDHACNLNNSQLSVHNCLSLQTKHIRIIQQVRKQKL